jgi:hypothetical protein
MAEVLSYYIVDSTNDKVLQVTDDGTALTLSQSSADFSNISTSIAFDDSDSGVLWVAVYNGNPGIMKLQKSDLTILQVALSDKNYSSGIGANEFQSLVAVGDYVYGCHQNNNQTSNIARMHKTTGVYEYWTLVSKNYSCHPMIVDAAGENLFVGTYFSLNPPKVVKWNIATQSIVDQFGTGVNGDFQGKQSISIAPNGYILYGFGSGLYGFGSGSTSILHAYDEDSQTVTWDSVRFGTDVCAVNTQVTGDIAIIGGGSGPQAVKAYNYKTGVATGDE